VYDMLKENTYGTNYILTPNTKCDYYYMSFQHLTFCPTCK
jgi:hypothetical protein